MSEHGDGPIRPKSYKDAINSDYITAEDLGGKPVTVTITEVELRLLEGEDGRQRKRIILHMRGAQKAWVSNTTNNICLAAMFGDNPQAAIGKRITIAPEMTSVGGVRVLGIRVMGSPDLERDMTISIRLPRRKVTQRMLRRTGAAKAPAPEPAPPPRDDPDETFGRAREQVQDHPRERQPGEDDE
jgi:hypothetical protein